MHSETCTSKSIIIWKWKIWAKVKNDTCNSENEIKLYSRFSLLHSGKF